MCYEMGCGAMRAKVMNFERSMGSRAEVKEKAKSKTIEKHLNSQSVHSLLSPRFPSITISK